MAALEASLARAKEQSAAAEESKGRGRKRQSA
jgi:hypothetical protein